MTEPKLQLQLHRKADLRKADLRDADLRDADLRDAYTTLRLTKQFAR